jgi:hypothetical protein
MLPVIEAAALAAMPADEMVARRFAEIEVSLLQEQARLASRRGDWETVERILTQMRAMAGDNAWVIGMLEQIAELARQRDTASFSKEAAYARESMSSRLSALNESYDMSAEARVARHLEKKLRHGRGRKPE